mmetsp:Transcript_9484/g.20903  ORF Transcript_9484/g.20903 Transcript_9484/m.20903 type:complete len:540 (+) Transcript_9484:53-1672(+)
MLKTFRELLKLYGKLALCHVVAKFILGALRRRKMMATLEQVPQAKYEAHPLLGQVPAFVKNRMRSHHWRDAATKDFAMCKFLPPFWDDKTMMVVVRDQRNIKHFLVDSFDKYTKATAQRSLIDSALLEWLGDGIFTALHGMGAPDRGAAWSRQRKIALQIFTRSNMTQLMAATFVAKGKRLCEILRDGECTDMQAHFFNYTMDSVMKVFFGADADTVGGESNAYGTAFDTAHRAMLKYVITSAQFGYFTKLFPFPFDGFDGAPMRMWKKFNPHYQQFRQAIRDLDEQSATIIESCRSDPNRKQRSDLLALYLNELDSEEGSEASTKFMRDTVMNLVIAGRDTTACTLSWLFFILGTHAEIQERVAAEVAEKLPIGTDPNVNAVRPENMPLLNALVYETLRLHPPVPVDFKVAQCDDVLPDGTKIPKRTCMVFFPWGMGRDPKVYPNPEKVDLERWIPFQNPPAHEFPVFQAGPRICLGKEMALFETKVLVAMLLQEFSFSLKEGEVDKVHYSMMITMSLCNSKGQDSHNLWMIPRKRRS